MSVTTSKPTALGVLHPQNWEQLVQFSNMASKSTMVPVSFRDKPQDIMLAIQMGSELGLTPMQAIQNIAVINGRPALWGDSVIALCRASPVCDDILETMEGDGDSLKAVCIAKRHGKEPVMRSFSMADAKQAGLLGKQGPWTQYTRRMLQMRARGFACRDAFPDVLRGLISAEEATDIPDDRAAFLGTTIDSTATVETGERSGTREAINSAVPLAPEGPARSDTDVWFDKLQKRLDDCKEASDVDAIIGEKEIKAALKKAQGDDLARLNGMIRAALGRFIQMKAPGEGSE